MRLRIVSWNVHSWRDSYLRPRFSEMLPVLIGFHPDILCLQEARWEPDRGIHSLELDTLRNELELFGFALAQTHLSPVKRQATGHVILVKGEVNEKKEFEIGKFFGISRKVLLIKTKMDDKMLHVATSHISPLPHPTVSFLKWSWLPRPREARRLVEVTSEFEPPLVLAVDLNASPESDEYRALRSLFNKPGRFPATHSSGLCVDYIFTSQDLEISQVSVNLTTSPSDHFPVVAEVKLS